MTGRGEYDYGQGGGKYGKSTGEGGGGRWLRYVVMAGITDVEIMWYGGGDEINRVKAGAWLRSRGESKGGI